MRKRSQIQPLVEAVGELESVDKRLVDAREMLADRLRGGRFGAVRGCDAWLRSGLG